MAKITRNTNTKKWEARVFWRDSDNQQQTKFKGGFIKKEDAEKWAVSVQSINVSGYKNAHKLKLGAFMDEWLKVFEKKVEIGKRSATTFSSYKSDVEKLKPLIGNEPLQTLRASKIQTAIDQLCGRPKTIDRAYRTLRACLSYACSVGIIQTNPAKYIDRPSGEQYKFSILQSSDAIKLLNVLKDMKHFLYGPVFLALYMALRRGEVFGLLWSDVHFDSRTIDIKNNRTIANGKEVNNAPKTESSFQSLLMPDSVYNFLFELRESQLSSGLIQSRVFDVSLDTVAHSARILKCVQSANGLKQCRFHDLRHSCASILNEAGVPMPVISALLRHANITITQNMYVHIFDGALKRASIAVDNILNFKQSETNQS